MWSAKPQKFTIWQLIPSLHPEPLATDLLSLTIVLSLLELHVNRIKQCIPFASSFLFRIMLLILTPGRKKAINRKDSKETKMLELAGKDLRHLF